ncbi:MAG: GAF domain-containing protein [Chloroflexota bacterium]|nr:GAF domain-containing protein [Chloroflexota bacterium]
MPFASEAIIRNPNRLAILRNLLLLDSAPEVAFDRLTRLTTWIIGAPVSLVSLIDADRQFFKSAVGLPEPWASERQTPLSHSFCQHVVATGEPLIIDDARNHPLVYDNLAIPDLNVIGYLGMPLVTSQGAKLGSFCVIDGKPRVWQPHEIEIMRELAQFVITEIELRGELIARQQMEAQLRTVNTQIAEANRQLRRVTEYSRATLDQTIETVQRGASRDEILVYLHSAQRGLMGKEM